MIRRAAVDHSRELLDDANFKKSGVWDAIKTTPQRPQASSLPCHTCAKEALNTALQTLGSNSGSQRDFNPLETAAARSMQDALITAGGRSHAFLVVPSTAVAAVGAAAQQLADRLDFLQRSLRHLYVLAPQSLMGLLPFQDLLARYEKVHFMTVGLQDDSALALACEFVCHVQYGEPSTQDVAAEAVHYVCSDEIIAAAVQALPA